MALSSLPMTPIHFTKDQQRVNIDAKLYTANNNR